MWRVGGASPGARWHRGRRAWRRTDAPGHGLGAGPGSARTAAGVPRLRASWGDGAVVIHRATSRGEGGRSRGCRSAPAENHWFLAETDLPSVSGAGQEPRGGRAMRRRPAASRGSRRFATSCTPRNCQPSESISAQPRLARRHQHRTGKSWYLDEFMGPRGPLSGTHVSPAHGWAVGGHIFGSSWWPYSPPRWIAPLRGALGLEVHGLCHTGIGPLELTPFRWDRGFSGTVGSGVGLRSSK